MLIINEFVSNSLKYAFSQGQKGQISIVFKRVNGDYELVLSDNGRGLPPGVDFSEKTTLGLRLMANLAKQIGGGIKSEAGKGTKFIVRFPEKKP